MRAQDGDASRDTVNAAGEDALGEVRDEFR
jgi:hypothetical protein